MLEFKYLYTTDVEITFDDYFVMTLEEANLAYVTKRIEWAGEKYHFTSAVAVDANTGEVLIIAKAPADKTDEDEEFMISEEEEYV